MDSLTPEQVFETLMQGNQRFSEGSCLHPNTSKERLAEVSKIQRPMAAVLGCADSRVPVEFLFDTGLGDLFVVRSAGNTPTVSSVASLEYAVQFLDVGLIIVLGHDQCGAVSAALDFDLVLTPSLEELIGGIRLNLSRHNPFPPLHSACRHNVVISSQRIVQRSVLLTDKVRAGKLVVKPLFYDISTGIIETLTAKV